MLIRCSESNLISAYSISTVVGGIGSVLINAGHFHQDLFFVVIHNFELFSSFLGNFLHLSSAKSNDNYG